MGQLCDGDGRRAGRRRHAGRIPSGHRGDVPRCRAWNARGPRGDATAQPRQHHPGGLRARLSRDPTAIGLLREQIRHPRLHRFAAGGADPRSFGRSHHHGADARDEHAAVRLGAQQARLRLSAGRRRVRSRRRRGCRMARTARSSAGAVGRRQRDRGDDRAAPRTRAARSLPCARRMGRPDERRAEFARARQPLPRQAIRARAAVLERGPNAGPPSSIPIAFARRS